MPDKQIALDCFLTEQGGLVGVAEDTSWVYTIASAEAETHLEKFILS